VQFEGDDLYQGIAFRRAAEAATYARFSGCDGQGQGLKPFSFLLTLSASLKRSPDTKSFFSNRTTSLRGAPRLHRVNGYTIRSL